MKANMKGEILRRSTVQFLVVTALLLCVLLTVAVFVFGVLGAQSVTQSGFSASPNVQVVFTDGPDPHEQW
jgi:hypothetical protein